MAEKNVQSKARFGAGEVTIVGRLMDELQGPNRRIRQEASHELAEICTSDQDKLGEQKEQVIEALIDALFRPEAQTRWEALDALRALAPNNAKLVSEAFEGAESSLLDESSSRVRLSSFRLLAALGAASPELSDKVWPLLDDAVRCYHGDPGYREMLQALLEMVGGKASQATKDALVEFIAFDAESGRGYVKTLSAEIIEACKKQ